MEGRLPLKQCRLRTQGVFQVVRAAGGIEPQGDALAKLCSTVCTRADILSPAAAPAPPPTGLTANSGLLI